MDTLNVPVKQRFEQRISRWYDLTVLYMKQLFEIKKEEYLNDKRLYRENQLKLKGASESAFK